MTGTRPPPVPCAPLLLRFSNEDIPIIRKVVAAYAATVATNVVAPQAINASTRIGTTKAIIEPRPVQICGSQLYSDPFVNLRRCSLYNT